MLPPETQETKVPERSQQGRRDECLHRRPLDEQQVQACLILLAPVHSHIGKLANSLSKAGGCEALKGRETMEDCLPNYCLVSHIDLRSEQYYKGTGSALQMSQPKYMQERGKQK